ncbi:carboxynorspermidine decarboxylase [Segatella baroniae B14]|jgi:carboxynorspermidine decarboxylase|uniref:Carboxynorspermidine/carboxyspermidine decarboxylase n=2 Tax=Segatella bryantii TaxID=77095 RepID=A0AA37HVN4_SEGBR|nr:carboxynorspermidine decarboxylase [Segatella bryantii]SDL55556.1 carboxynorspermidine decarboxylase [Segatella bryantii]SEA15432.1 carboxynorspermidine decarboxylase [Segatella bryantii]SEQ81707.1 carboxynorspermidine decarboxylase [Segatella baroniae B14]
MSNIIHDKKLSLHDKINFGQIMKVNLDTFQQINKPVYVLEEQRLRNNLSLISEVARTGGIDIILAFKAYALWKTFPIFREYIRATTASSLSEAKLALLEFGSKAHTFSPAYTDYEIDEIAHCSSHLTFNSLSQYQRYHQRVRQANSEISLGIRINPEYSEIETDLYNPCAPGTRFGVSADKLPEILPEDIEGFHCHCHCENGSDVFQRTLTHIEDKFAKWFPQIKWINFGGGHLMTRKDYDIPLLIQILTDFKKKYPNLHVILEPGSAFGWQTGSLVSQVVDVVEDKGIKTAILNVSFTCHMPDCLEMPYWPSVRNAKVIEGRYDKSIPYLYRLGGNSCLSGDFMESWQFDHELQIGENIIFEDMLHYTTVKTNMFNGITHPSIGIVHLNGELEILKDFGYEDYRDRMD